MQAITIGLALSLAFVNSVQAGKKLSDIEVVNIESQYCHFRQVTVKHTDTELSVSGRMESHVRFSDTFPALHRNEPQQAQNPVHNLAVAS